MTRPSNGGSGMGAATEDALQPSRGQDCEGERILRFGASMDVKRLVDELAMITRQRRRM